MIVISPIHSLRLARSPIVGRSSLLLWRSSIASRPNLILRLKFSTSRLLSQNQVDHKNVPKTSAKLGPSNVKTLAEPTKLPTEKPAVPKPSDLVSQVYTIPNILTMTRIATTPFIGYFLATGQSTPAIVLFAYSCATDFVDGYIARRFNLKSVLGSVLDPAADKFLMTVCTVALSVQHIMPWYAATLILGRDVLLSVIGMYVRWRSLPPPQTLKRFLDLSIPTHSIHPNLLGKVNTALQMFYIGGLVLLPWFDEVTGWHESLAVFFEYFGYLVTATTFCSGVSYLVGRNSAKRLIQKQ